MAMPLKVAGNYHQKIGGGKYEVEKRMAAFCVVIMIISVVSASCCFVEAVKKKGYSVPFAQLVIVEDAEHRPRQEEAKVAWDFIKIFLSEVRDETWKKKNGFWFIHCGNDLCFICL